MTLTKAIAILQTKSRDELLAITSKIVKIRGINQKAKDKMLFIVSNPYTENLGAIPVGDRAIKYTTMTKLCGSPMLAVARLLIEGALHNDGKYQTREVMVNAVEYFDGRLFYMDEEGLSLSRKREAGYILSLAGFVRKNTHRPDLGVSVQCWVTDEVYEGLTVDQRVELLYETMDKVTGIKTMKVEDLI